jgi:ferredoxin-NADP reductase
VLVTDGDIEDSGSSFALTAAERSAGWALVCASRPLSDMGSLKGYDAYVRGPPAIVQAARELVVRLGVREANVYFDAFVPTGGEPTANTGWDAMPEH